MNRFALVLVAVVSTAGLRPPLAAQQAPPAIPPDLTDYIKKPEPDFAWKLVDKTETDVGAVYALKLTSQKWHDELWEHDLVVTVPKNAPPAKTWVLLNTGGKPNAGMNLVGLETARRVNGPVAVLYGIPKQPLYGNKKEDALIAETFVRFLESGDGSWPLLFPMAKSVVKAMDALQAFAKKDMKTEVTGFVVTGASKRGWTSWLTAASGDPRVKGIAPMVIDTLNFGKQIPLHLSSFGRYSEMIHDYEERKLLPMPDTAAARRLWTLVDPWVYRSRLTLPKMLLVGTNDPYWPLEALNQYWDDLPGEKYVTYTPNAGHDLRETDADGKKAVLPMKAVNALAAFSRHVVAGKPMPKLTWAHADANGRPTISVESDVPMKSIKVWEAESKTKDFRKSRWAVGETATGAVLKTTLSGSAGVTAEYRAILAECEYDVDGLTYSLTTQLRMLPVKK